MKSIALYTALLISQLAFGQNFILENKSWHVRNEFWGDIFTWIYKIEGETVINSITYKNLWATFDTNFSNVWIEGYIREESDVVYYRSIYNVEEGILYDFNLEAGDTTYITNEYCEGQMVVITDVDTIEFYGIERKRWTLSSWWGGGEDYWLEGIGSTCGPVHSLFSECIFDVWFDLLCFHENDTLFYILPGEDECFQTNVGLSEAVDVGHVLIKPNPVIKGQSFVLQCDKSIEEVEIYNSAGVMVKHFPVEHQQSLLISSIQLSGGLYLMRIKTTENQVLSGKIIIR
jgi:hypothetical protein